MTIQRINIARDKEKIVKKVGSPDLEDVYMVWMMKCDTLQSRMNDLKREAVGSLKYSRKVYTACDKLMKDKNTSKEEKAMLSAIRKAAYVFGTDLKKLGIA